MLWIIAGVVIGAASVGPVMSDVEEAKYDVYHSYGKIEVRDYAAMIIAETEVTGEREEAIELGFRQIADYIFGNNTASGKVAMTAPVVQKRNEKIAMTAPVIQKGAESGWKVSFVMPASYNINSLPRPNNKKVKLIEIEPKRFAVIRFSGFASEESLAEKEGELFSFIEDNKFRPVGVTTYAFYNPPWTLPFLRRNEVMIEIVK